MLYVKVSDTYHVSRLCKNDQKDPYVSMSYSNYCGQQGLFSSRGPQGQASRTGGASDPTYVPAGKEDGQQFTVTVDGHDVTREIRRPEVDGNVSPVSAYAGVRAAMNPQFRRIAERGRVIMAGRDIGTVVLPNADFKIYLDATVDERARRRQIEREAQGRPISFQQMRQEIRGRDEFDSSRPVAPLRRAADAVLLDNTGLTIQETVERALDLIQRRSA